MPSANVLRKAEYMKRKNPDITSGFFIPDCSSACPYVVMKSLKIDFGLRCKSKHKIDINQIKMKNACEFPRKRLRYTFLI